MPDYESYSGIQTQEQQYYGLSVNLVTTVTQGFGTGLVFGVLGDWVGGASKSPELGLLVKSAALGPIGLMAAAIFGTFFGGQDVAIPTFPRTYADLGKAYQAGQKQGG